MMFTEPPLSWSRSWPLHFQFCWHIEASVEAQVLWIFLRIYYWEETAEEYPRAKCEQCKNAEQRTASLSLFWCVALLFFFVMATFYDLPARYMWRTLLMSKAMEEWTEIVKGARYIQPQLREAGREDLRNLKALPRQSRERQARRRFGQTVDSRWRYHGRGWPVQVQQATGVHWTALHWGDSMATGRWESRPPCAPL